MKRPSSLTISLAVASLILLWGTTWAAIRLGLQGVPPFLGASLRFVVGSVLFLLIAPFFKVSLREGRYRARVWVTNGLLLFCVSYGTVYWAEQWVPSGLAAILFATLPLFVALYAHFLLPGERLGPRVLLGILVGFAGVFVIYSEDLERLGGAQTALASLVFLLSPASASLANVLVKKWGADVHPISTIAVPMPVGAAILGAGAAAFEGDAQVRFDPLSVGCILYLALFGTVVAFSLFFWVMKHIPVTKLSLIAYGMPVVAVLVGVIFLNEPFTWRILLGSAGVIAGAAVTGRARQGKRFATTGAMRNSGQAGRVGPPHSTRAT